MSSGYAQESQVMNQAGRIARPAEPLAQQQEHMTRTLSEILQQVETVVSVLGIQRPEKDPALPTASGIVGTMELHLTAVQAILEKVARIRSTLAG